MRSPLFAISKIVKNRLTSALQVIEQITQGRGQVFVLGDFGGHALEGFEDAGSVGLEIFLYHVF